MHTETTEPPPGTVAPPHTFHIPVMGTGFTLDTAVKAAKFGISSVVSLVDDVLIEQMRRFHSERAGIPFDPIAGSDPDPRAHRITAYLNLLNLIVRRQSAELQAAPFEPGSEITRYFEMLPDGSLKDAYRAMCGETDPARRKDLQSELRARAVPGSIDVNIMTKLDCAHYENGEPLPPEHNDAMAALRGFAHSNLEAAVVLSAGMNPRLYCYLSKFKDFVADTYGTVKKRIILKVSDYRSALIQGKFLAKHGLWVSEYRIESGLNCGGHTFPTKGLLLGPILDEFRVKRDEFIDAVWAVYNKARTHAHPPSTSQPPHMRITVQGGIGSADEDRLLRSYYGMEGTGWGTPFLLVPEVVNLDSEHIDKLRRATGDDVYPSWSSPLGIPFWNLRHSASEDARRRRIREGRPGSSCPKGYLMLDTEFSKRPICRAARAYQQRKLRLIAENQALSEAQAQAMREDVLAKACICHDLGGSVTVTHGIDPEATTAVCCGPNIRYFSRIARLDEMIDHIYGRTSLLTDPERPHLFIEELRIYIEHLATEIQRTSLGLAAQTPRYFQEFADNLRSGIQYYREMVGEFVEGHRERILDDLSRLERRLLAIPLPAEETA